MPLNLKTLVNMQRARLWLTGLVAGLLLLVSAGIRAHDTPVVSLTLTEIDAGRYSLSWSPDDIDAALHVAFPGHCELQAQVLACGSQGMMGKLTVDGLGKRYAAVVVRVPAQPGERDPRIYTLTAAQQDIMLVPAAGNTLRHTAAVYLPLGIEHIVLGVDHLLFVLGLLMLTRGLADLVKTITAFTLAHSVSLAAAVFSWITVNEALVNALIALSIAVLAVEVVHRQRGRIGWSQRAPWLVAFGFGLLHGLGFAGGLVSLGLDQHTLVGALLFFNLGVEAGQLLFVGLVLGMVASYRSLGVILSDRICTGAIYGVGAIASYWFVARVAMMFSG
ncbi:HupE/UreJ family protein [Teredinibacter turnerae]|uniref:HupE/UreJ family protein n=1 Tax=Teredinibacter turnerae TaxID=2426 RepID=UPI001E2F6E11|nr:HupE/UreJ family protein [Teredinibacter turnerae]